ncbi:MAG: extracellular solute-binding protein [Proteobacteria bacterium]|nr:extracellular solute-binding protein [Pseudomonadota bacterium]
MPARSFLAALAMAAATLLATSPASAGPGDLVIVTREDSFQRALQAAYVQPFTAVTGLPVQQQTWEGGLDALRAQVKSADNDWSLVLVDPDELAAGCGEGLFEKLDWSMIGGKDHYQGFAVSDCGVGAVLVNTVLAWDRDKFPVTPTWADFWDVAKYPGKRGLRKGVRGNLEIALMADGVAPGDVYKTLSTNDGIDRAFRKLDQLKPYIQWWSKEIEAAKALEAGGVLMTTGPSGPIAIKGQQEHRNFGLQFSGSLYELHSWAIMKGAQALRTAQQFLYFTGMQAVEWRLLKSAGNTGLTKGVNDGLPPDQLAILPSNPANLSGALRLDASFWRDNGSKLRQRFETWLEH